MWQNLIIGIIFQGISFLLMGRKTPDVPERPSLEDFDRPKAEEGEEFGRIYGTYWLNDPQTHWWGDLTTRPITTEQSKK